ncbi:hypothetical protein FY030_09760 [Ornithinimicrobium pratense]|uniref:Uncharacterized protein n=1 Tax=Ornithinimicrobium pratense TaxID=2593973 RepID=A0A5J6V758_9MICO|nr:hypothetical protein FY030_09760 [Ornithinimicrobium pratense]
MQIDIPAMRRLISDVDGTMTSAFTNHQTLTGLLSQASASASVATPMLSAATWLEEQGPDLRRRLALAEQVAASSPGASLMVEIDESLLSDLTPEEARLLARELAEELREGPHTEGLVERLAENASDPYFAEALLAELSPEELATYLESVDFSVQRPGQAEIDYARRHGVIITSLRTALQTAARADRLPDGYAEQLSEFIWTGDGAGAVALADFLNDTEDLHPSLAAPTSEAREMVTGYHDLVEAGVLTAPPTAYLREWIGNVQGRDLVALAQQEGVQDDTFDLLMELEVIRDPEGRAFFQFGLDHADDARRIAELTELLDGREPSTNAWRRDANSWTFDTLLGQGDIRLVLNDGGALAATPEGIFMAVGDSSRLVTSTDLFAHSGGTMWGEIFMINQEDEDPGQRLRDIIEIGSLSRREDGHPLADILRHEAVHGQQWAREGHALFIAKYGFWAVRFGGDMCKHPFEIEAGLEDGNYSCP